MGDEISDAMNLDLNLGPDPETLVGGSIANESVSLEDWMDEPRISESVRPRTRQRWRWRNLHVNPPEPHRSLFSSHDAHERYIMAPDSHAISLRLSEMLTPHRPGNGSVLQAGEGSMAAEDRTEVTPKACEANNGVLDDGESDKKDSVEKGSGSDGSFFDCNICLDLARDPVVTCCGHLFCWPCLYRWLHEHSEAKECPVCKGEVTMKNVTPIYGRGNNVGEHEEDPILKVPVRPHARRVESLRQTINRNAFAFPVEEMIRRLGSRFDLSRDVGQPNESDNAREAVDRTTLLNRFMTSRALRREHMHESIADDVVDLTQNNVNVPEVRDHPRLQSFLLRRAQSHRTTLSSLSSALSSAERFVEAYIRSHSIARNQEQPPPVDDRDSFSSVAAVIHSESQVDTAVEIDSMVSLSTSSSRRRNDASRVSDVDSGDSRAPRRRRLN